MGNVAFQRIFSLEQEREEDKLCASLPSPISESSDVASILKVKQNFAEVTKDGDFRSSSGTVCAKCHSPCVRCLPVYGSSVDVPSLNTLNPGSYCNKYNRSEGERIDSSTQTDLSYSQSPLGMKASSVSLPDVISSSPFRCSLVPKIPPLPPPPPPPPPPPSPPASSFPSTRFKITKGQRNKKKSMEKKEKLQAAGVALVSITAEEIKNVKLKKTDSQPLKSQNKLISKETSSSSQAMVTLQALQNISLKKTSQLSSDGKHGGETVPDIKKILKRTTMQRSPGGTPIQAKQNADSSKENTPWASKSLKATVRNKPSVSPHAEKKD